MYEIARVHSVSYVLIIFLILWLIWDGVRYLLGQKTFSQQMNEWGVKWPLIKLGYIVGALFLYVHFWH